MSESSSFKAPGGIDRRQLLAMGGATFGLAAIGIFAGADAAYGATIGDPWVAHIKSWNWNWLAHRNGGYSGGQDYDFDYGDAIYAPAAGTLGSGSGGVVRFTLDSTVSRIVAAEGGEAAGQLAALEFMHLSDYGTSGYFGAGAGPIAYVGDTGVSSAHLHVHGISTTGGRVDWRKFVSGPGTGPIVNLTGGSHMAYLIYKAAGTSPVTPVKRAYYRPGSPVRVISDTEVYVVESFIKKFRKLPASTPTADVTANLNDAEWNFLIALEGIEP